jgi:hypothetical protein
MAKATEAESPPDEALWRSFQSGHAATIDAWVEAEDVIASMLTLGLPDGTIGDRLIVAEAELQRAIVEFAAEHSEGADPTLTALTLLRRAESLLPGKGSPDQPEKPG